VPPLFLSWFLLANTPAAHCFFVFEEIIFLASKTKNQRAAAQRHESKNP
jgi:hypothetical protein